ncbi:hypothetical protein [Alteromonas sp. KUL49]|uniref:hypothetical protein n=1 Tax=Alteromonas sp. KUL49 TaxID=2480798 RepID=UPI00102F0ED2|nr:hypothetical protein [Alteromonas sp. KUL49]TAP34139.1 hypothetical protein EYS00_19685 [Alteromonas sp. KUL49]GEA13625.1 hypothetical protein KUL49_40000 [Alteromonas sp. KUL49]
MTLHSKISVNSLYTRSINLERDSDNEKLISSYIPTARAKSLYERITSVLNNELAPRAYSLIGPYGSGKSSFSVFLSHLLSNSDSDEFKLSHEVLESNNIEHGKIIKQHVEGSDGYIQVLISGSPEPLSKRILSGLHNAVSVYWSSRKGPKPKFIKELKEAISSNLTGKDVSDFFAQTQAELNKLTTRKPRGILLVIDELGKFLEYEARHYGANDIFTLQTLAEQACEASECTFLIFVMLHQSFEQYSKGLGESLKNEWAKVQGRYEEVPFLESAEQTLKVVANAIAHDFDQEESKHVEANVEKVTSALNTEKALPSVLQLEDASALFNGCYPLHPITSLLLPYLCQKLAQNERTLFSFLGSKEEFGFEDSVKKLVGIGDFIDPDIVFDYFITNQASVISDNTTHRRWAEVISALERLGNNAPVSAIKLLKLIGLFNIIGSKGQFKPSEKLLKTIYSDESQYKQDISLLVSKSILTYRAFNDEYRVWQGSDFDLEDEVQNQLSMLGNFSLAEQLNEAEILEPIVAKKYTITNGAIRYYLPEFTDATQFNCTIKRETSAPKIIFFLSFGQDDETLFLNKLVKQVGKKNIAVLARNSSQLKDAFAEIFALKRIEESSQALKEDPVAKKEFSERYAAAIQLGHNLAKSCITQPELADWYFDGFKLEVQSSRKLQSVLSDVMDSLYKKAPSFHNELINKDKPSSQAAAGRKQLINRLIHNASEEMLGFSSDKFPPEKSMYLSLILEHGLHKQIKGKWVLSEPNKTSSLVPVWTRLDKFASSAEDSARSFVDISEELKSAPYGVKEGVLPIVYLVYYLVKQNELAWFEEGKFQPSLTIEAAERFLKVPHLFSVQSFKIEGLKASLFSSYKSALFGDKADLKERTVIDIARPLAKFIADLEEYTRHTTSPTLSTKAKKLSKVFETSKSPHKLLFNQLPKALGFNEDVIENGDEKILSSFSEVLTETLRELKYHYKEMLYEQLRLIATAFSFDSLTEISDIRESIRGSFLGLDGYSVDTDGTKAFIARLTNKEGSDYQWLENILTFLASKPPHKWYDKDRSQADYKLAGFKQKLLDIKHFAEEERDQNLGDFEVVMLKSIKKGKAQKHKMIAISDSQKEAADDLKSQIEQLFENADPNLVLTALADIVDDRLEEQK